jgi:arabinosaccharide transport system substrate-binding protein
MRPPRRFPAFFSWTTPAVWLLLVIALVTTALIWLRPPPVRAGLSLWVFAQPHQSAYVPVIKQWNAEQTDPAHRAECLLIDFPALERRLLSGLLSGTPVGELVEVERAVAARTFTGPLDDIGFYDLTDRLKAEGLLDVLNPPSFAPWISRGRVFGIPHDVHPVLLVYRSDLTDAAGIDMSKIETWEEFFTALRPLMADANGDGHPDRYLMNFWPSNVVLLEGLLLQAGGGFFGPDERLVIDSEVNARVLASLATWCGGPARVALDVPDFNAAGNTLRLRGTVVAALMPDWLAGRWRIDMPELAGKLRLMPMPAWERGGMRTTTYGGTMLGIPKSTKDFEAAWRFAKRLYLDPETHVSFFRETNIIPPVKTSWNHPAFSEPNPYFGGQLVGKLYIDQAGNIPVRTSSPYNNFALDRVADALLQLIDVAERENVSDPTALLEAARAKLREAQRQTARQIERNVFFRADADRSGASTSANPTVAPAASATPPLSTAPAALPLPSAPPTP